MLSVLIAPKLACAQSSGSVHGTVKDPQGTFVPGAKVALRNTATNTKLDTVTNDDGRFVFGYVNAAAYELTVQKDGFRLISAPLTVQVAQVVDLNLTLELGQVNETVTVTESTLAINTLNGELSHEISGKELHELPLLNQNYYELMKLTPGAADTGSVTGDVRGSSAMSGGGGIAVGGARTSSVNFMLDGAENNDTFVAGVAQDIPLDTVQEFKVQANGATAEYGRNPVITNVVSKSGTNALHGSLYEVYRGAALSTATFDDKASGNPKSNFVRNQFGGSLGGRIIKDKLFYFGSVEGIRVRSSGTARFFVPVQSFLDNAAPAVVSYMKTYGLPGSNCSDRALTAAQIWDDVEGNRAADGSSTYGTTSTSGLFNANSGALIPGTTQLFCRTTLQAPVDAGGGTPQNTWLATGRVDYQYSSKTSFFARYAYGKTENPVGAGSVSPYPVFSTPATAFSQNIAATLTHSFSTSIFSELRVSFNRVHPELPLGKAPGTAPCWQYNRNLDGLTGTGDKITFPGYLPGACLGAGLDVGGPQNVYQESGSLTWVKGRHTFKSGGSYFHMRHNHTFGAYENGYYESPSMNDMLGGQIVLFAQALDPKGHVPGDTYNPAVDGAFKAPDFTRHYHYNELAGYGEDTIRLNNKLSFSLGLRWEYFGVQHSPENERFLDANLYLNAVGSVPPLTASKNIYQEVRDARFRRTNQFYRPDYGNFGPRAGLAYDLFGNGRTVLRGAYGIYYDRNFGNATFNAIQNPPNYAVVSLQSGVDVPGNLPVFTDVAGPLAGTGTKPLPAVSQRAINQNINTAYAETWTLSVDRRVGRGVFSVAYAGSHGVHLYDIANVNPARGGSVYLGDARGANRINYQYSNMNFRSDNGFSRYNALNFKYGVTNLLNKGLGLTANYTWSHALDNLSSTFSDGNGATTSGIYQLGYLDAFNPRLNFGNADFDIRHRFNLSWTWEVPWMKSSSHAFARNVLGGWGLGSILSIRSGSPFTIYDSSGFNGTASPLWIPPSAIPRTGTPTATGQNLFNYIALPFTTVLVNGTPTPVVDNLGVSLGIPNCTGLNHTGCTYSTNGQPYPERNQFVGPGYWNLDMNFYKTFKLTERFGLQFRGEFYNILNHHNQYITTENLDVNSLTTPFIQTQKGGIYGLAGQPNDERRNIQFGLKLTF